MAIQVYIFFFMFFSGQAMVKVRQQQPQVLQLQMPQHRLPMLHSGPPTGPSMDSNMVSGQVMVNKLRRVKLRLVMVPLQDPRELVPHNKTLDLQLNGLKRL